MKAITGEMIVTGISARNDGSLSLRMSTPELQSAEKLALIELQNRMVIVLIQPKDESPSELKEIKNKFDVKTPSARLRAVLFVQFKQTKILGEFEDFYRRQIERMIDDIKSQLQPE